MTHLEAIQAWKESGSTDKFATWDIRRRIAEKDAAEQEETDEE